MLRGYGFSAGFLKSLVADGVPNSSVTEGTGDRGWTRWERLLFWGPIPVGVVLLIWGDTVDRVFGALIAGVPLACAAWGLSRLLNDRRTAKRASGNP
jgi:hypothetical protein